MLRSVPRSAVRVALIVGITGLVVALAGRGAVATTVTNAASPVWTPPVTISDPVLPADSVSVASDAVYDPWQRAKSLAAWRVFDGEHWRIAVSTDLGGHWTSPQLVSAAGVDAGHPSAGVASEFTEYGGLYEQVAWLLSTGEVQVAVKPAHAKSWAPPVTISAPGAIAEAPISSVSWQDDGGGTYAVPAVVWLARDGAHWRAHYLT